MLQLELDDRYPSESIREYIYRVIKKNILHVKLRPGENVSEKSISHLLDVSRTPIRETFSRLFQEGMLDVYPQKGTYVSLIDMKRVADSVFLRLAIENAIMEVACRHFSDENLFRLESNIHQQVFCFDKGKYAEVLELDNKMHELIFSSCDLVRVWQAFQSISIDQFRIRYLKLATNIRWNETIAEHREIIRTIKEHDVEGGRKIMREHVLKIHEDSEEIRKRYPDYFKKA